MVAGMNGKTQLARAVWIFAASDDEPTPVQLVMGIEGQPVAETGQDRLAPRRNLADRFALQVACIRFQMVKCKEHFCHPLAGNGSEKLVCRTAYFGSFRQGRISQIWMGIFGGFPNNTDRPVAMQKILNATILLQALHQTT